MLLQLTRRLLGLPEPQGKCFEGRLDSHGADGDEAREIVLVT